MLLKVFQQANAIPAEDSVFTIDELVSAIMQASSAQPVDEVEDVLQNGFGRTLHVRFVRLHLPRPQVSLFIRPCH